MIIALAAPEVAMHESARISCSPSGLYARRDLCTSRQDIGLERQPSRLLREREPSEELAAPPPNQQQRVPQVP